MEFLKRLLEQGKALYARLNTTQKIIAGSIAGVIFVAFIVLFALSAEKPNVILFTDLPSEEMGTVTKKLDELGYKYSTSGSNTVYVDPKQREVIMTRLAQENAIPKGIPGWKLFDMTKWTETDREIDVKYMRALRDELKRHIEALKNIEKADDEIAMSNDELFTSKGSDYTAAVTLYLAPGYDSLTKKEIKGIQYLVARGVGTKLKPENVTITDDSGNILSDFEDSMDLAKEEFVQLQYRKRIEEQERVKMLKNIRAGLERIYTPDRIQIVNLDMQFNWDKVKEHRKDYSPIEMVPQDPTKPYNTREVVPSITVSRKKTDENFKGHGWNPQGPAGTESNKPPGYKGADDQFSEYSKQENIENNVVNESEKDIQKDPYDMTKVSVAIAIDGIQMLPTQPDGEFDLDPSKKPIQNPLTPEELRQAEDIVKAAVGFDEARGDQVSVKNIMFDRSRDWKGMREEYRRKEQLKRMMLAGLVGVFALFLGFILFGAIKREINRRRRIHEEQLALEQQRMREAALRAAEDEGVEVELSLEEKARHELQDNATNLAKERPDDVAKLLRTWLAEE
ncbi:MAG TPA: flagellar basal-body MS-ring/collar protein FliF [Spirochaetota bacterium]